MMHGTTNIKNRGTTHPVAHHHISGDPCCKQECCKNLKLDQPTGHHENALQCVCISICKGGILLPNYATSHYRRQ